MATHVERWGFPAVALALALAGCAQLPGPVGAPASAQGRAELALGDVGEDPARLAQRFAASAARAYPGTGDVSEAVGELKRQGFDCARPRADRGAPPAQACRRRIEANGCTHTWQVFLYDGQPARGLYDRACGDDELLGGPA